MEASSPVTMIRAEVSRASSSLDCGACILGGLCSQHSRAVRDRRNSLSPVAVTAAIHRAHRYPRLTLAPIAIKSTALMARLADGAMALSLAPLAPTFPLFPCASLGAWGAGRIATSRRARQRKCGALQACSNLFLETAGGPEFRCSLPLEPADLLRRMRKKPPAHVCQSDR